MEYLFEYRLKGDVEWHKKGGPRQSYSRTKATLESYREYRPDLEFRVLERTVGEWQETDLT